MKKHLVITTALSLLPSFSFAADDMLAAAMKRIEELEAKNKALIIEVGSLKGKKSYQFTKTKNNQNSQTEHIEKPEIKVQTVPAYSAPSLSGFYAGINGGYGGGDVTGVQDEYSLPVLGDTSPINIYTNGVKTSRYGGALVGGQIGYNYIFKNNLLIGAAIDLDWTDISNNSNSYGGFYSPYGSTYGTNGSRDGLRWLGTARGRLGYSIGSITPFISSGLAFGGAANYSRIVSGSASSNGWFGVSGETDTTKTSIGWTAGSGLEYSITNSISFSTEYLFTSISPSPQKGYLLNSNSQPFINIISTNSYGDPLGFHQVRVGLNYHFNTNEDKVAAKY